MRFMQIRKVLQPHLSDRCLPSLLGSSSKNVSPFNRRPIRNARGFSQGRETEIGGSRWQDEIDGHARTPSGARSLYDKWAGDYDECAARWGYIIPDKIAEIVREQMPIHDSMAPDILDLGCGSGLLGAALKKINMDTSNLDGSDISENSLNIAQQKSAYRKLTCYDLCRLPLPFNTQSYDCIIAMALLSYIEDRKGFLQDVVRIARPGGLLIFTHRDDRMEDVIGDGVDLALQALASSNVAHIICRESNLPYYPKYATEGYPDATASVIVLRISPTP